MNTGVDVLWIARYDFDAFNRYQSHAHECYQLSFIFSGGGTITIGEKSYKISRQSLLFIPPKTSHNLETISETVKTYNIKFNVTAQKLSAKARLVPPVMTAPLSLLDDLTEIHCYGMEKPPYYKDKCQLKIAELIIDILSLIEKEISFHHRDHQPVKKNSSPLQFVLDYLNRKYQTPVNAQSLEAECGYSYRYLSTLFKKEFGIPPIAYLEKLRIEKARDLISHSDWELKKIAETVGFHSVHYFTSVFKKHTGLPPGEWRRREVGGIGKDILINENFVNHMYIAKG